MSVADLLSPLPKAWCNLNVNSINIGSGGSTLQGPLTISENSASGNPIVNIVETNSSASNINNALQSYNQSGTAGLKLVTVNDPTPSANIWADGNFSIVTFEPTATIALNPRNSANALVCSFVSPGQTLTQIQNLQLPTTGGTATNLNYYEEYSSPFVFSGPWGATTYTRNVTITRIGRMCTLKIDAISQTGSSISNISMTGSIPTRFIPAATADYTSEIFPIMVFDKGANVSGILNLSNTGAILIQCLNNGGGFPLLYGTFSGIGVTGFNNIFMSYSV